MGLQWMIYDLAKIFCCIGIRLLAAQFQIVLSKHLVAIFGIFRNGSTLIV